MKPPSTVAALALALATGACTVFPPLGLPPSVTETAEVDYRFGGDGPRTIQVPASGDDITVFDLTVEPQASAERFVRGQRFLDFDAGVDVVRVLCRLRRYARTSSDLAPPRDLFPGAARVRFFDDAPLP